MSTGSLLPPGQEVDCDCPVRLERTVLFDPTGWNRRVTACHGCGAVSLVEAQVEEPHPHDVRCVGNLVLEMSDALRDWFDAWPRQATGLRGRARDIYLSRSLRVMSVDELRAAEEVALSEQRDLDVRTRLERLGYPRSPPPEALPPPLVPFVDLQAGLALDAETPLDELMRIGGGRSWAMAFALPLLKARAAYPDCVVAWLSAPDTERRHAALNLVESARIALLPVIDALERMILASSRMENSLYGLINIARALTPESARLAAAFRTRAAGIGDGDYYLTKSLNEAAAALEAAGRDASGG